MNHTGPIARLTDSDLNRLVRFSQGFPTSDAALQDPALQGPGGLSKRELLESLKL